MCVVVQPWGCYTMLPHTNKTDGTQTTPAGHTYKNHVRPAYGM